MAPVAAGERIEVLDVLRGAALFGILAANMRALGAPWLLYDKPDLLFPGFADRLVQGLIDVFVMGFILLAFRKRQPSTILRWAMGMPLVLTILGCIAFVVFQFIRLPPRPLHAELAEVTRLARAFREGGLFDVVAHNLLSWVTFLPRNLVLLFLLPAFLFGLWVWRKGIPQDLDSYAGALRRTCRVALPLGVALNTFAVAETILRTGMRPRPPDFLVFAAVMSRIYGTYVLALGYAAGLALLAREERWRRRLAPAGAVGRMALTNYVLQSLVCVTLFTTTDLYAKVGPALLMIPTVAVYAGQVWFSNWWMRRFRYGPMEWLWRSLTYGSIGPLRHAPGAALTAGG
jgi:uncharacterized protein